MEGQCCSAEGSWPLAGEIRQLLGEDFALDPAFLEESWTSGEPAAYRTRPSRRDRPARQDAESCTFAELGNVGNFFFSIAGEGSHDRSAQLRPAAPSASYAASWLHEPIEGSHASQSDQALPAGSAAFQGYANDAAMLLPLKYRRACELLHVSQHSSAVQIKAAYRRMVGQWHPDRIERGSEEARAVATKQMVAINEAYQLLRNRPSTECS